MENPNEENYLFEEAAAMEKFAAIPVLCPEIVNTTLKIDIEKYFDDVKVDYPVEILKYRTQYNSLSAIFQHLVRPIRALCKLFCIHI